MRVPCLNRFSSNGCKGTEQAEHLVLQLCWPHFLEAWKLSAAIGKGVAIPEPRQKSNHDWTLVPQPLANGSEFVMRMIFRCLISKDYAIDISTVKYGIDRELRLHQASAHESRMVDMILRCWPSQPTGIGPQVRPQSASAGRS